MSLEDAGETGLNSGAEGAIPVNSQAKELFFRAWIVQRQSGERWFQYHPPKEK
jgi:hypothetical protein